MLSNLGPVSLFFSNVMAIVVLIGLRSLGHSPAESVCLLAVGNLLCGSLVLFPQLTGRATSDWSFKTTISFAAWTICYSVSYGLYALFPYAMSLSDIIIAESLAPTAAVVVSGDWRNESERFKRLFSNMGVITLLLLIAYLKRDRTSQTLEASGKYWLVFITILCFLGSNVCARNVSKIGPALWSQARVSALNGLLLTLFILGTQRFNGVMNLKSAAVPGTLFAIGILIAQGSFIFGLARTSPFFSALLISTTVPLSLLSEAIANGHPLASVEGALGVLYCFFIWLTQKWFSRETPLTTTQPSSLQPSGDA